MIADIEYGTALPHTLLSLPRYAQILNLDPIYFFGGYSTLRTAGACNDTWFEYSWQDGGKVSRQEIILQILRAEQEIADFVGFWPAPRWIEDEEHTYPQFFDRAYQQTTGMTPRHAKALKLNYGYAHYGGVRATTEITTATRGADVDTTGDGYDDMAVFTITGVTFEPQEIHAFYKEYDALDAENCRTDPESSGADVAWELRDIRINYNDATQVATVYIPKWQLFKPQLQRIINVAPLDADVATNYVDNLVFYRVYNDPSDQVEFLWTADMECSSVACAWASQTGCAQFSDKRQAIAMLSPGSYDADAGTFTSESFSECVEPHKVLVSYYAGYLDPYARGADKLSTFWATQIAKLATSRVPRKFCYCENIQLLVDRWQEDVALTNETRSYTAFDLDNPFGTRVGELEVYRALKRYGLRVKKGVNPYV